MSQLKNKNIVIIGGSTGIGLSAAKAFVAEGACVVIVGRNLTTVDTAGTAIEQNRKNRAGNGEEGRSGTTAGTELGSAVRSLVGDASDANTAKKAIALCVSEFGSFDGLYHVAGGSGRKMGDGPLHELTLEGWDKTLQLNLTSLMLSNQAAVHHFLEHQKGGTILNMGSVLGFSPSPEYFSTHAYAAAKAAIIGFSKSVAAYYAKDNIRINVIAPALVETPMAQRAANDAEILNFIKGKQPLDGGRIGQPEDLDGLAVYFMSDGSKYTTGQVVAVDGGWSVSEG